MTRIEWAKNEVKLACKKEAPNRKEGEWDYGCACYESALKAYLSLMSDNHSGLSFSFTKAILNRLMNDIPLTPLENTNEDWQYVYTEEDGTDIYLHKRWSKLRRNVKPDKSIEYLRSDCTCIDIDSGLSYTGGGAREVFNNIVPPIEFPFRPELTDYKLFTREFLTDRKNGDFDTKEYLYAMTPQGQRIEINRYFGDVDGMWKEINYTEFQERVKLHNIREHEETLKESMKKKDIEDIEQAENEMAAEAELESEMEEKKEDDI